MNFDKLFEEFIDEIQGEGTYASSDEIRIATKEMLDVIKNNKDATPDELVELIIKDNLEQIENIKKKYNIPGYIVNINIDNINVKFMGGNIDYNGRKMSDDALFDLASITKFYTQVVLYNLINEAISLTNGAKKSGATTYAKSDSKIGQIKIGDSLSKE